LRSAGAGWLPIDSPQVGLVTWYGPNGAAVALATSWLGVIDGHPPELLAGCRSRTTVPELFPSGADFAVNIPAGPDVAALCELLQKLPPGCPVHIGTGPELRPGHRVQAPLLACCALRIECRHGRVQPRDWEAELAGEIVLLHRGALAFDPADHVEFSALHPLRQVEISGPASLRASR